VLCRSVRGMRVRSEVIIDMFTFSGGEKKTIITSVKSKNMIHETR
jgi:hypothetical protein